MRFSFSCFIIAAVTLAAAQDLPRRATLGVPLRAVPAELNEKYKLLPQNAAEVATGTTALPGDVKNGDIVIAIDGKKFKSFGEMNDIVRNLKAGSKVKLTVLSDGKEATREITVNERPRDPGDATYEVIYDHVVSNGNRIRTIISKPKKAGRHPVFYWMQGINTGSVDFPLTTQNYMAPILKAFSDDGFVTVRVEKTGVGDSEGGPANSVAFNEENDIYLQALKSFDKYDFIDRSKVFVFGHSMGGCHAPIIGAQLPIKGIITYGTVSDSWLEWQIKADRWQSILGGADPVQVDKDVRKTVTFYSAIYNEKKTVEQFIKEHPELADFAKERSPDGINFNPRSIKYMQELNDKNFSEYWSKVGDAKVLALFGEHDFVALEGDQTQIPVVVNRVKAGNASFQKVKDSDHGFSKTTSFQDSIAKFGRPGAEFNPEIIRVCREWVKSILE